MGIEGKGRMAARGWWPGGLAGLQAWLGSRKMMKKGLAWLWVERGCIMLDYPVIARNQGITLENQGTQDVENYHYLYLYFEF